MVYTQLDHNNENRVKGSDVGEGKAENQCVCSALQAFRFWLPPGPGI
jgi:hypothetical protein